MSLAFYFHYSIDFEVFGVLFDRGQARHGMETLLSTILTLKYRDTNKTI